MTAIKGVHCDAETWVVCFGNQHPFTKCGGVTSQGFDSDLLGPGQAFTLRFDQPGSFPFTCSLHPQMNGTVLVNQGS